MTAGKSAVLDGCGKYQRNTPREGYFGCEAISHLSSGPWRVLQEGERGGRQHQVAKAGREGGERSLRGAAFRGGCHRTVAIAPSAVRIRDLDENRKNDYEIGI